MLGSTARPRPDQPGLAAHVPPRREVCGKFCSCFPARASRGVVTQRLGLRARAEKRGKARRGERETGNERKPHRTPGSISTPRTLLSASPPCPPPSSLFSPNRRPPAPPPPSLPRCPLPIPSAPHTLLPGSALLPPPSLRPACLLPSASPPLPGRHHFVPPGGRGKPLAGGHHSPAPGCHPAPHPCALGPSVSRAARRGHGAPPAGPRTLAWSPAALRPAPRGSALRPPGGRRRRRRPPW